MATTTTLKLTDALKRRIAPLAEESGKTAHAWMLDAIEAQAELAEKRRLLYADADAAWRDVEATGKAYRAEDVHRFIRDRVDAKTSPRPRLVKAK